MEAAQRTLLDGDGPLVKFNGATSKWCCMLCKRQFPSEKQLGQHLAGSEMHRTNLAEAEASGRIRAPPPSSAEASPPEKGGDGSRKRPLEDDSRLGGSQRLRQMEEIERALAAKSASGLGAAASGSEKQPVYRDRAKERREQGGGYANLVLDTSNAKSARDINGNLDWRCGHCNKVNFAREITCTSCTRRVDDTTQYLDSSDFQKQRHQGMLKLAQRLEPGMADGDRAGRRPLS